MLDHIEEAAGNVRADIMAVSYGRRAHHVHPLHPAEPGGKLALFVVEALCLILGSQVKMQDQLNRLNSLIDTIGSRLGNVTTDLTELVDKCQAHVNGDSEIDVGVVADRLQGVVDRLATIDQAITHANSAAGTNQSGSGASTTDTGPATDTGTAAAGEAPAEVDPNAPPAGATNTGEGAGGGQESPPAE